MSNIVIHPIPPLFDSNSSVLILGSFPSVKSRETCFFYGHPQNRFWKVISTVLGAPLPTDIEQKKLLLLSHGIALWDTIAKCEIVGSSDASIANPVANDITVITDCADIKQIYCNGKKSFDMYKKYIEPQIHRSALCLPSTSPANASWSIERLVVSWSCIKKHLSN